MPKELIIADHDGAIIFHGYLQVDGDDFGWIGNMPYFVKTVSLFDDEETRKIKEEKYAKRDL